ncbi:response regulator transcription factor [Arthrobacter sp. CAU 1506]|uniref:response regulator n=1 Tax=Arthrobacter sp. CAU 1506 TaxID=2560052 RepID=UPI0010ABBDCC|nr:response regulator transcription factor [Arthrobacter sp. CAU 1506]TJY67471.1 response regulator transcription factor [Arthrobacter sp. CAU 1506]
MTPSVRVLLADDHSAIRAGLRLILEMDQQVEVVGEAGDGAQAIKMARQLKPDLVLMDVRMPGMDGIEATRVIAGEKLASVLVLTTFDLDEYVFEAVRAGAAGFLLKSVEPPALLDAVRRVAAGDGVVAPEVTRRLLDAFAAGPPSPSSAVGTRPDREADARLAILTDRERDVLTALGRGLSNQEISAELFISETTTKTHVSRILHKLGCSSRMQAAVVAREAGLGTQGSEARLHNGP